MLKSEDYNYTKEKEYLHIGVTVTASMEVVLFWQSNSNKSFNYTTAILSPRLFYVKASVIE